MKKKKDASGPKTRDLTPGFAFTSTIPGSTFACSVGGADPASCSSPFSVPTKLERGEFHTFSVHAVSPSGVADPTPASITFRVTDKRKPKPKRTGALFSSCIALAFPGLPPVCAPRV